MPTARDIGYQLGKQAGVLGSISGATGSGIQQVLNTLGGRNLWGTKLVEMMKGKAPGRHAQTFMDSGNKAPVFAANSAGKMPTNVDPANRVKRLETVAAGRGMDSGRQALGATALASVPMTYLLNKYLGANSESDPKPPQPMTGLPNA